MANEWNRMIINIPPAKTDIVVLQQQNNAVMISVIWSIIYNKSNNDSFMSIVLEATITQLYGLDECRHQCWS